MVDAIAAQFITTYYATFDSNRPGLKQLYVSQCIRIRGVVEYLAM